MSNPQSDYISLLKNSEALIEGHFVLSSGLHSKYYVQCAKLMANPKYAKELCSALVEKIKNSVDISKITKIVSPAMGGILVGYELSRQLEITNIFCERVDGKFAFRRGFFLDDTDNVLVVEDVITTGKSSLETYEIIKSCGAKIIAEACLIRRNPRIDFLDNVKIIPLIDFEIPTYNDKELPSDLASIPVTKPGSRFLRK